MSHFEKFNVLPNKSKKQLEHLTERKRLKWKKLNKTAYSKDQALHIIRKSYPQSPPPQNLQLGPTSESDLEFLAKSKDKRLIYTILGINGEQLRDARLIARDVQKFLKRGQVEKAVFLTRLAKKKGAAAMNSIMEYYFNELNQPQSAVDMYNWRKKWDIPINEYSNTILFKGLAEQKSSFVSNNTAEMILNIVTRRIESGELNQIEFNAALGALANCTDVTGAFKLYEKQIPGIKRDAITYTWMLRACSRIKTEELFLEMVDELIKTIPGRIIDSRLLFEYCKAFHSRESPSPKIKYACLYALNEYFQLSLTPEFLKNVPNSELQLYPLSHWNIDRKFSVNKHVIGLFVESCLKANCNDVSIKWVKDNLSTSKKTMLDLPIFYSILQAIIKTHPTTCGDECSELFKVTKSMEGIPFSKHTLKLVYKAYERQALRSYTNKDDIKCQNLITNCQKFISENESVYSNTLKEKVYPKQVYQFLFPIIKNCNANGKVSNATLKSITQEFLKTILAGFYNDGNEKESIEKKKYLALEAIRFINTTIERMRMDGFDGDIKKLPTEERKTFHTRRLLLRLKENLLEQITAFEGKDTKSLDEIQTGLKQLTQRLLPKLSENTVPL